MRKTITEAEMRERLRAACKQHGGQAAVARLAGVSRPMVSLVLSGREHPGTKIAAFLGLTERKEKVYIMNDEAA